MLENSWAAVFAVDVGNGTVFIGPGLELAAATDSWPEDYGDFVGDLESALRVNADRVRLRAAFVRWGQKHEPRPINEHRLCFEVAEMVRAGVLEARFLPSFFDDRRGPEGGAEGPFGHFQMDGVYQPAKGGVTSAPSSSTPVMRLTPRPAAASGPTEFPNESRQANTLKDAAKSGVPFCEVCAAAKAA